MRFYKVYSLNKKRLIALTRRRRFLWAVATIITLVGCRSALYFISQRDVRHGRQNVLPSDVSMQLSWDGSPVINAALQTIYCSIPKNSCTFMKRLMLKLQRRETWNATENVSNLIHNPAINGLSYMSNLSLHVATSILQDSRWTKLVVFREPVERFASAFLDKCVVGRMSVYDGKQPAHTCPVHDRYLSLSADAVLSEIERTVERGGFMAVDSHFRSQMTFCDIHKHSGAYIVLHKDKLKHDLRYVFGHMDVSSSTRRYALESIDSVIELMNSANHNTNSTRLAQTWMAALTQCCRHAKHLGRNRAAEICGGMIGHRLQVLYAADLEFYKKYGLIKTISSNPMR